MSMSSLSFATPGNEQESQQQQQQEDSTCSVADLWQSLDRELRLNIGTSVRCGICLTTITDPVRTPCVHAFCKDCIHASLMSGNQKCPECNTAITKRGLQPFEYLEDLSNAYKATLREFAFIPTQYNPQFVTMTQKVDACDDEEEDEATPQQMLDRLDVATAWQQQGLPNVPNVPAIQKSENDQVVQSNWDACQDFLVEVKKLPTTQEMQEQTREQEQADEEWNERRMEDEKDENEDENENEVQDIASASTLLEDVTPRHTNKTFMEETGTDTNKERSLSPAPSSSPPFVDTELSPIQVHASQPTEPVTENSSLTNQQKVTDVTGMMEDSFGALHLMPNESNLIKDNEQKTTADVQVQQQQQQDEDSDKTQTPMSASSESKASSSSKKFDLDPSLVYKWNSFEQEEEFGVGMSPRYRTKLGKILSNRKMQQLELESNQSSVEEETDSKPAAKQLFQEDDEVHDKEVDETGDADDEMDDNPADEEEEEKSSAMAKKPEDTMVIDEEDEEDEYGFSTKQTTSLVQQVRVPVPTMSNEESGWSIGDIVNVQSRTWPGVNKPGGVARITKIHNGGSCYDVSYVLGGKEANIDSGFLSHNQDLSPPIETINETHNMLLDSQRQRARRQRRRRRCEQEQNELPMALLQSLEHDGYDITGNASLQARVVKKQKTAKAVLQDTTNETSKKTNPKKAQVKMTVATKDTTVITPIENANKKLKKRVSFGHTAPGLSLEEAILSADVSYSKRLEVAIKNKMVHIVTSNLAQDDAMMLKEVAATIKTQQDVKVRVTNTFHKNATICILPVVGTKGSSTVRPKVRTVKAMRSALAGVPMVSPEWIKVLASKEEVIYPPTSMIVRTLPTKTSQTNNDGGVAQLAAAPDKGKALLQDFAIYLCGSFPNNQRIDMQALASTAGAKVLKESSQVLHRLRQHKPLVVLCFNGNIIPTLLEKDLTSSLTENQDACLVVNPNWLFDSIACAKAMPPNNFPPPDFPKSRKAYELWRLCCYKNPFK